MDSLSFGTDVSAVIRDSAAAADPFYESAASPTSLASVMRHSILVREPTEPIAFPFGVEEVSAAK